MSWTTNYLRRIGIGAAILVAAATAAEARTDVRTMSCSAAKDLVYSAGAVVLTTGPNSYDRYVSGQNYCAYPLVAKPAWVPTADNAQCPVGFLCKQKVDTHND